MSAPAAAGIAPALVVVDTDKVVVEVRQVAALLLARATEFVVMPSTRADASALLVDVANLKRKAEDRRRGILDPHTKYSKRVNDLFRVVIAPVVEADEILRAKLRDFIRREEAEEIEAQAEARRATLRTEALAGQAVAAEAAGETAVAEQLLGEAVQAEGQAQALATFVAAAPPVARTVHTVGGGLVGAKKIWTFSILNVDDVPEEYLKPREVDGTKVRAAIAAGIRDGDGTPGIAGIRIYEDDQIQVRG